MKNFRVIFSLMAILAIVSCSTKPENTWEAQYSKDGKDSVVYVKYQNADGTNSNFFMNYLLFRSLFNSGGYGQVYNYYRRTPDFAAPRPQNYYTTNNYYSKPNSTNNSWKGQSNSVSRSSTSTFSNSPSKTTSSPSRTYTPSKSYSSPSRSYSSPSRSYSSPSRSYSSPSRSYSSPSRH